jgi:hypothetical protein
MTVVVQDPPAETNGDTITELLNEAIDVFPDFEIDLDREQFAEIPGGSLNSTEPGGNSSSGGGGGGGGGNTPAPTPIATTPKPTPKPADAKSSMLVWIIVGAVLAVALFIGVAIVLWRRRKPATDSATAQENVEGTNAQARFQHFAQTRGYANYSMPDNQVRFNPATGEFLGPAMASMASMAARPATQYRGMPPIGKSYYSGPPVQRA